MLAKALVAFTSNIAIVALNLQFFVDLNVSCPQSVQINVFTYIFHDSFTYSS